MSLQTFRFLDNRSTDNSILKIEFTKVFHHQGANLETPDHIKEFTFGENINYHQIDHSYFLFDVTIRKVALPAADGNPPNPPDIDFIDADQIRLLNIAFAYCFNGVMVATTGVSDLEVNKYLGQVSTIMRMLTSKDGVLISNSDKIDESEAGIGNSSLKQMLNSNHTKDGKKGKKIRSTTTRTHFWIFKKITENLGFHLRLKMAVLQDIMFATLPNDITVSFNC